MTKDEQAVVDAAREVYKHRDKESLDELFATVQQLDKPPMGSERAAFEAALDEFGRKAGYPYGRSYDSNQSRDAVLALYTAEVAARERAELVAVEAMDEVREREAACCPEDVPFDEHIAALKKRTEAAEAIAAELHEEVTAQMYLCSTIATVTADRDRLRAELAHIIGGGGVL